MALSGTQIEELAAEFQRAGYLHLPRVVDASALTELSRQLLAEYRRARHAGELFSAGGTISGHLNCFPGAGARFVFEQVRDFGVLSVVRRLSDQAVRMPNVGCNLNLPGSHAQNLHVDGYAATPFMVVNIAAVDTTLINGAMEACPGSHRRDHKYWEFVLARYPSVRLPLAVGDVVIRVSTLWHRGMPNRSDSARPMLALSWEDGGSTLDDPYTAHAGAIRFFPNRYGTNLAGELKERAFAALPGLGSGYRFLRSILES
ncbi:MAG TPA: phytanoyl-CoA dioxygenase family protein [Polyangiales bacterium]